MNGVHVGSPFQWVNAVVFTAALKWNTTNVFAAVVDNSGGGPAGFIASILVTYSDGTTSTFVSDSSWKTFVGSVPDGSTLPSTDDSSWPFSVEQATDGSFWAPVNLPLALGGFQGSDWIWTNEGDPNANNFPAETRGFRKSFTSGGTKCGQCAQILITS